ncbi:phosphatidylethanolamine N-methyltransferase [Microthyrium microscopicum]|uniref:Phosphatidylethanolamine N-methyltransferase n=1 Tax=Microthyrium microscopicum TaxID=703497 RepID=A0A6A6UN39_9PEZI|nr:phosphatidylethanolamine N-methyltransferase [Microthyrium microscopicum]
MSDNSPVAGDNQLRSRPSTTKPSVNFTEPEESAQEKVLRMNQDQNNVKSGKTFGRTPNGTVFTVPETHDMVSQLLSPTQPKNASDIILLLVLGLHISLLIFLPVSWRIPVIAVVYSFWRCAYNAGIGYLLQAQSDDRRLVCWARKLAIFEPPTSGKNPRPWLFNIIKREFEIKLPKDYKIEDAPIEYNTWLLFRRLVDLILMCDFVSYVLFALACAHQPAGEGTLMMLGRWSCGIFLFLINLWVKLDAHRVVKDYAWYWGDFFFLVDQELTFDGVFEMAPHPMYSIGYVGYYGMAMMAASYKVLLLSVVAHCAQFAFLWFVENPHIEKIYNPPPKRLVDVPEMEPTDEISDSGNVHDHEGTQQPSAVHRIIGLQNTDFHRAVDIAVFLLQAHMFLLTIFTPSTKWSQLAFLVNALFWRLWFTVGIGFLLNMQSSKKSWTRHFIKYGEDSHEAWRQWKGMYHISMHMCYASFIAVAWKSYHLPADWNYGSVLLRHVLGGFFIALHIWTVLSCYDSLGEFGWFYGDFFYEPKDKITYNGIYRFLNNPERVLGLAGLWGAALITWSYAIFALALISNGLMLAFIQFVERPHMQKLYGESLRDQSGLSKGFRKSLPEPLANWQESVDQRVGQTTDFFNDFMDTARPKLAAGVTTIVRDATSLFKNYPAKISITRVAEDIAKYDTEDYSLSIEATPTSPRAEVDRRSRREGEIGQQPPVRTSPYSTLLFEYGAPIKVKWTAPLNHGKKDWIGLYMVSDSPDRQISRITSRGRWIATTPGEYDSSRADSGILQSDVLVAKTGSINEHYEGEMVFEGDKLWWTTGVFEFRYHHDGKHNVMAISNPFEIRIGKFDEDDADLDSNGTLRGAVEQALLPVVRNCFDRDPEIAPNTVDQAFGGLVERDGKFTNRVSFAIQQMFTIDLSSEVVKADGNIKNLAWRICNAKKVLEPYSLTNTQSGRATPRETKW